MKKLIAVSLMLTLLAAFVVAQEGSGIGISADITGKFDIVNYKSYPGILEDDPKGYRDTLAGNLTPDAALTFKGDDGTAGFTVLLDLDKIVPLLYQARSGGGGVTVDTLEDTEVSVWFKPLASDLLTIKAGWNAGDGTLQYGDLSSQPNNIIPGDFARLIVEDYINGFGSDPAGFIITSAPMPGLFLGLGWRAPLKDYANAANVIDANTGGYGTAYGKLGDTLTAIQIGVGYEIPNIGAARLQYFGPYPYSYDLGADDFGYNSLNDYYVDPTGLQGNPGEISKFNSIQLGFKVYALQNIGLDLDIVAQIPLGFTAKNANGDEAVYGAPIKFAVIAAFATGPISVNGGLGLALPFKAVGGDAKWENDAIELKFNAEPAYKVSDALTVGADIGFVLDPNQLSGYKDDGYYYFYADEDDGEKKAGAPMDLGLGAFVKYTVGKGTLKTGLAVKLINVGGVYSGGNTDTVAKSVEFKIPVTLNVVF